MLLAVSQATSLSCVHVCVDLTGGYSLSLSCLTVRAWLWLLHAMRHQPMSISIRYAVTQLIRCSLFPFFTTGMCYKLVFLLLNFMKGTLLDLTVIWVNAGGYYSRWRIAICFPNGWRQFLPQPSRSIVSAYCLVRHGTEEMTCCQGLLTIRAHELVLSLAVILPNYCY